MCFYLCERKTMDKEHFNIMEAYFISCIIMCVVYFFTSLSTTLLIMAAAVSLIFGLSLVIWILYLLYKVFCWATDPYFARIEKRMEEAELQVWLEEMKQKKS